MDGQLPAGRGDWIRTRFITAADLLLTMTTALRQIRLAQTRKRGIPAYRLPDRGKSMPVL